MNNQYIQLQFDKLMYTLKSTYAEGDLLFFSTM